MGVLESIFGKKQPETKETRILSILLKLNDLQSDIKAQFPPVDRLEEDLIDSIRGSVINYNKHLKSTITILFHLDKSISDKIKFFYLPETKEHLKIQQSSKQSLFTKLDTAHKELEVLIKQIKAKQIQELKKAA